MSIDSQSYSFSDLMEMFDGNIDNVKSTVNIFCSQMALDIQNLKQHFLRKDFSSVKSFAHRMKPNLKMFHMMDLHQLVMDIEKTAIEGDQGLLGQQLEVFYDKAQSRCKLILKESEKLV